MKLSPEQYREIYNKLPDPLKDVAVSGQVNEKIYEICQRHKLHIDEAGKVYDITMDIVMGVIPAKNFESEIIQELKLAPLEASALVRDIDTEVLSPVKETMMRTFKGGNPFKPQTLKYIEDTDEHSALNRDNLLHEIENPQIVTVQKTNPSTEKPAVAPAPVPPSEETKLNEKPDPMKATRERLLSAIGEEKLPGMVAMKQFMNPAAAKPASVQKTVENIRSIPKPDYIGPDKSIAVKPMIKLVEESALSASAPLPVEAVSHLPQVQVVKPSTPATPTAKQSPKPEIDPYRESIE